MSDDTPQRPRAPRFPPKPPSQAARWGEVLARYTPVIRTSARIASFASVLPGGRSLRPVARLLRGAALAGTLLKALAHLPKGQKGPRAPSASSSAAPSGGGRQGGGLSGRFPPRRRSPRPPPPPPPTGPRMPSPRPPTGPRMPSPRAAATTAGGGSGGASPGWQRAPLFPVGPGTPPAFRSRKSAAQGQDGGASGGADGGDTEGPSASASQRRATVLRAAKPTKLVEKLADVLGGRRPGELARRMDGIGGGRGGMGAGMGGGGSDFPPDFGDAAGGGPGGGQGVGSDGSMQEMARDVREILELLRKQQSGAEGQQGQQPPGMSDAMEAGRRVVDTLKSGEALVSAADTAITWARQLGPLIGAVMGGA